MLRKTHDESRVGRKGKRKEEPMHNIYDSQPESDPRTTVKFQQSRRFRTARDLHAQLMNIDHELEVTKEYYAEMMDAINKETARVEQQDMQLTELRRKCSVASKLIKFLVNADNPDSSASKADAARMVHELQTSSAMSQMMVDSIKEPISEYFIRGTDIDGFVQSKLDELTELLDKTETNQLETESSKVMDTTHTNSYTQVAGKVTNKDDFNIGMKTRHSVESPNSTPVVTNVEDVLSRTSIRPSFKEDMQKRQTGVEIALPEMTGLVMDPAKDNPVASLPKIDSHSESSIAE